MAEILVREMMNHKPVTLPAATPLEEVTGVMSSQKVSCVIIVEGTEPVGIVTERDLVRHLNKLLSGKGDRGDISSANDIMSQQPVTIHDDATLFDALVLAQSRKIRHLPATDAEGNLTGILTYTDLANATRRVIEHQSEVIDSSVRAKTAELEDANGRLKALSLEDPLLAIGNRRAMEVDLSYTNDTAVRYGRTYSIVLFDIDSFKQYNDHYGHQAGDSALKVVADQLKASVRSADRLYRYGGEEILLLLPETPLAGAEILAGRALSSLSQLQIPHEGSAHKVLTMSGGIGSPQHGDCRDNATGWKEIVEIADLGLYQAKRSGRNQIAAA